MNVVGEAADWPTTLVNAPQSSMEMLLVEWSMLPPDSGSQALQELRLACPGAIVVVLISQLDAREQAARSAGADLFISKIDTPERLADRLRLYAGGLSLAKLQEG
jgi:DNA-binding NarL/FixJ family response regulator